jgi:predicted ribonuclease YlaK
LYTFNFLDELSCNKTSEKEKEKECRHAIKQTTRLFLERNRKDEKNELHVLEYGKKYLYVFLTSSSRQNKIKVFRKSHKKEHISGSTLAREVRFLPLVS